MAFAHMPDFGNTYYSFENLVIRDKMVEICALASGSNGNCYYVGNESDAVLIDAGIYYNRLIERAEAAGVDIDKVRAVFISHEHTDHVSGAYGIAKRLCLPFYFTRKTFNSKHRNFNKEKNKT